MKNFATRYSHWLLLGFFYILYSITSIYILDPDFGWTIPLGDHILQNGIPITDIFTYSMPSYPFVDHEWITHVAIAWLYARVGMPGLALLFAAIATAALHVATQNAPTAWRRIIIVLLGMLLLNAISVRPQIISFLFFAFITQLALYKDRWEKWKWSLPLLFVLWTNLHGGFVIGLGTIGLITLLRSYEAKKIVWIDICIVILSLAGTLINPYGIRLWQEVLLSVFDARLRYTVNEWMPTIVTLEPSIWFFVAVTITYLLAKHKMIDWKVKLLFCIFLFLGITSYRNISLFAIFAAAASTFGYNAIQQTTVKHAAYRQRLLMFHTRFFLILLVGMIVHIATLHRINIQKNSEVGNYPAQAIRYLRTHPPAGNVLSLYEWGGYLLWKYPEKKVFIDGRMPSWRQDITYKPNESADASWEYLELFNFLKPFKPTLERHAISTIVMRTEMIVVTENMHRKKKKEVAKLTEQMQINNMILVYQDPIASIFNIENQ